MRKSHSQLQSKRNSDRSVRKTGMAAYKSWWYLGAAALILIAAFAVIALRDRNAVPPVAAGALPAEISVSDAYARVDAGAYLLDVRTIEEWNTSHVENSTHIPLNDLAARLDEIPKDQDVVIVCRTGNRSQQGREILKEAGFERVTSVAGGLVDWQAAGYPTVSGP